MGHYQAGESGGGWFGGCEEPASEGDIVGGLEGDVALWHCCESWDGVIGALERWLGLKRLDLIPYLS